jgi:hypothetical protein
VENYRARRVPERRPTIRVSWRAHAARAPRALALPAPAQRFFAPRFELPRLEDFRGGTFAPFFRDSLRAMAIACFRLVTFRPDPLFSVPFFFRRMVDSTFFCAALPYFAIGIS